MMERGQALPTSARGETSQPGWPCRPPWGERNRAAGGESSPTAAIQAGFPSSELQEAHGGVGAEEESHSHTVHKGRWQGCRNPEAPGGTWPKRERNGPGRKAEMEAISGKPSLASDLGFSVMRQAVLKPMQELGCLSLSE